MHKSPVFMFVRSGMPLLMFYRRRPESAVAEFSLNKGTMTLIDEARADYLTSVMLKRVEESGGSAGNTAVGLAGLGARSAYIGKVRDDLLGKSFAESMRRSNVHFGTPMATHGPATARSLIFVTPDHQRTMNTYLGACVNLGPEDIDPEVIEHSAVTYMEGYLWDMEAAKAAFRKAIKLAHGAGRKTALSLSDPFCVERFRAEFKELIENDIDILFANADEICALYETESFEEAREKVRGKVEIAALTRGVKGSEIIHGDQTTPCPIVPVQHRVDTTGRGFLCRWFPLWLYGGQTDAGLRALGLCRCRCRHSGVRRAPDPGGFGLGANGCLRGNS